MPPPFYIDGALKVDKWLSLQKTPYAATFYIDGALKVFKWLSLQLQLLRYFFLIRYKRLPLPSPSVIKIIKCLLNKSLVINGFRFAQMVSGFLSKFSKGGPFKGTVRLDYNSIKQDGGIVLGNVT